MVTKEQAIAGGGVVSLLVAGGVAIYLNSKKKAPITTPIVPPPQLPPTVSPPQLGVTISVQIMRVSTKAYQQYTGEAPATATFNASTSGGLSPYTYSWDFGDGATGTGANISHTYSSAGTYTAKVTVVDSLKKSASASVTLNIVPPLSISFTPTIMGLRVKAQQVAPATVGFTANVTGGAPPYSYSWNFGDGSSGSGASTSHIYNNSGAYTIGVKVIDSIGKSASASTTITVSAPSPTPVVPPATTVTQVQLTMLTQSPTVGSPIPFQVLTIGPSGGLGGIPYSISVNGNSVYTGTTGSNGTDLLNVTLQNYGNYQIVAQAGGVSSIAVAINLVAPPPPPPPPAVPSTAMTWTAGPYTLSITSTNLTPTTPASLTVNGVVSGSVVFVNIIWQDGTRYQIGTATSSGSSVQVPFNSLYQIFSTLGGPSYGSYALEVVIKTLTMLVDKNVFVSTLIETSNSMYSGNYYIPNFTVTIPAPTLTIKDLGQISLQSGVTTHRIQAILVSNAGPFTGYKITLVNPKNLSSLGSGTTDSSGVATIDVTMQSGTTVPLVAFYPEYPPRLSTDLTSSQINVAFAAKRIVRSPVKKMNIVWK